MLAVTTFPPSAWDYYAKACLSQMVKLWPGSVRAYFEGSGPPTLDGAEFRPLDAIEERAGFLARPIDESRGFLFAAKRFCHKVFAQLDTAKDGEPFWWIDADVLMSASPPEEILQQDELVTFLGRDSYTETGLIGFNPNHSEWEDFESRYRAMYTEGRILNLPFRTDCHAFDAARKGRGKNLTPGGRGFENVMERSAFAPYMAHHKGNRKVEIYRRMNA